MAKKRAATAAPSDLIGIIKRVGHAIAAGLDVNDEEAVAKLATQLEPDLAPRIIPDRRYRLRELKKFGFTPGSLYKSHRDVIRHDEKANITFVLGRDVWKLNDTALTLGASPTVASVALPRRRGRPRKDAKRSTDDSTDSLTIRNVAGGDNSVVRIPHWMHRTEKCFGLIRKAA
jgi:hypothetical protein